MGDDDGRREGDSLRADYRFARVSSTAKYDADEIG
jgi:hypothetical protein